MTQLKELLAGYRAEALRTMRDKQGLTEADARLKDEIIAQLARRFAERAHVQAALAVLDESARRTLELVQLAGGRVDRETLVGLLSNEREVENVKINRASSYTSPNIEGHPNALGSLASRTFWRGWRCRGS